MPLIILEGGRSVLDGSTCIKIARRILRENYEGFSCFFAELFSTCFRLEDAEARQCFLVAFLTRRCHVLLEIFLNIFAYYADPTCPDPLPPYLQNIDLRRIKYIVEKYFVTDSNLITQAGEIAERYHDCGRFPKIIILDEIILHGRAVNSLLLKLECGILRRLEQLEPELDPLDRSLVITQLSHAIDLQIYAQNNEPLLLLDRYSRRLHTKRLCNPIEIRNLSNSFATLVANGNVNNVAYSWNFNISTPEAKKSWEALSPAPGFVKVETKLKSIWQTCCLWPYPNASAPKAVCAIRWKQGGEASDDILVVPFLVTDRLPRENLYRLHKKICEDISGKKLSFLTDYNDSDIGAADSSRLRWLSETNELILSYLMFRRFCQNDDSNVQWAKYLETAILARNYKLPFSGEEDRGKIVKELESIWTWEPPCPDLLEQYLDILLTNAKPLWNAAESIGVSSGPRRVDGSTPESRRLITAVEDTIASFGYEAEQNACEKYSSSIFFSDETLSDWGRKYSLSEMLIRCGKYLRESSNSSVMDVYSAFALIIQEMDLGIISMNSQYDSSADQVYSMARAGEHSLFIKPTRYRDFIPVLIQIYKKCHNCQLDLYLEIKQFIKHLSASQPDLGTTAEELCDFMQDLERTNQKIEDWNLVLPDYGNSAHFDVRSMNKQISYLLEYRKI